ncbi:MAG: RtcB family protein [Spirochaetes bacterium]|nr:RtcB family protein [Spirochaetota bacterium]
MSAPCEELQGKYNKAYIYAENLEDEARKQIYAFLNHDAFSGGRIAIMPDVHAGKGAVIGFTAPLGDKVIPNVIGVDIGCGVRTWKLGEEKPDFDALERFIRREIPSGAGVRGSADTKTIGRCPIGGEETFERFSKRLEKICKRQEQDFGRVLCSIGSLGGGNHFIEVDRDSKGAFWLTIHSGSRNFGLRVAEYHQKHARKVCGSMGGLEYLTGTDRDAYLDDMRTAQVYASLNRAVMGSSIIRGVFGRDAGNCPSIESVHNFISADNVIRKGAISAHKDERVVVPFNMRDGIVIGRGKGNKAWNQSAPHGAGRTMSRSRAKSELKLDEFRKTMDGIYTTCVGRNTIDESPMAYKDAARIIDLLEDTVDVEDRLKPVYNFKASE